MFRLDNDSIGATTEQYNQHTGEIHFATVSQNKNYDFVDLKVVQSAGQCSNNEYRTL